MIKNESTSYKTTPLYNEVLEFVRDELNFPVHDLNMVQGGEIAQAYEYSHEGLSFILKMGTNEANFRKEKVAHHLCFGSEVVVPKVYNIGTYKAGLAYSLAEKAAGIRGDVLLKSLPPPQHEILIRVLSRNLAALHAVQIPAGDSYGWWMPDVPPNHKTWSEFLVSSTKAQLPTGILFGAKSEITRWSAQFLKLCDSMPNIRSLTHGDYSLDNIFSDGKKITGVIDWTESMYGDPLYDVAYLRFWLPLARSERFLKEYLSFANSHNAIHVNVSERLLCYSLRIGLRALEFYEKSGREEDFLNTVQRVKDGH